MAAVTVQMQQKSSTTTEGQVRGHSVLIDRPVSKGGSDEGAMGGELLLMSLGGCFMSNLLEIIRTREASIHNVQIDVVGQTGRHSGTLYSHRYADSRPLRRHRADAKVCHHGGTRLHCRQQHRRCY